MNSKRTFAFASVLLVLMGLGARQFLSPRAPQELSLNESDNEVLFPIEPLETVERELEPKVQRILEPKVQRQPAAHLKGDAVPAPLARQRKTLQTWAREVSALKACLRVECSFANGDPREYELEVGYALREKAQEIYSGLKKDSSLRSLPEEMEQLLSEWALVESGHAQSVLLDIYSLLEPSPRRLNSLLQTLSLNNYDRRLMEKSIDVLAQYQTVDNSQQISEFVSQEIRNGPVGTKELFSKSVIRILNSENRPLFEKTLRQIDPTSQRARFLRQALKEQDRIESGG